MKQGALRFSRAKKFMGVRKAPGPKNTTIWSVYWEPTLKQLIKGHRAEHLGQVYWHSPWRRYAFFPAFETVFEDSCMTKIGQFCKNATSLFRQGRFLTSPTKGAQNG